MIYKIHDECMSHLYELCASQHILLKHVYKVNAISLIAIGLLTYFLIG